MTLPLEPVDPLEGLLRIAESVEQLQAAGADADADRILGRLVDALGTELVRRGDPITTAMLELDAELSRLATMRLAARAVVRTTTTKGE